MLKLLYGVMVGVNIMIVSDYIYSTETHYIDSEYSKTVFIPADITPDTRNEQNVSCDSTELEEVRMSREVNI
ncbi:hypothetical protein N9W79_00310 [bacterium]|nr:hypothetical protein [bacterium]